MSGNQLHIEPEKRLSPMTELAERLVQKYHGQERTQDEDALYTAAMTWLIRGFRQNDVTHVFSRINSDIEEAIRKGAGSTIRQERRRVPQPITEGKVQKGGQNPPEPSTERPPAPQGSSG